MVVKKFNKKRFITFMIVLLLIIGGIIYGIISLVNLINYRKSNEYKLLEQGYSINEVKVLLDKLNEKEINNLLTRKKDSSILEYINENYFIYDNLDKYIEYAKRNKYDKDKIIRIINTEANIDWFDNEKETNIEDKELMLVNRLYSLGEYVPEDIVDIPVKYAYSGKKISKSILDSLMALCDEASENGFTFVVSDGYRSYKEQKKLYDSYSNNYGKSEADKIVARPGHSEYLLTLYHIINHILIQKIVKNINGLKVMHINMALYLDFQQIKNT